MDTADHSKKNRKKPKFISFLGCFGFSGKDKYSSKTVIKSPPPPNPRFRRSTFLFKQSPTKTVPLDSNLSENLQSRKSFALKKSKPKQKSGEIPLKSQTPASDNFKVAYKDQPQETRSSFEKKVIIENGKILENMINPHPNNAAFRRKIEAIKKGSSQPGTPDVKAKFNPTTIIRSTSFPNPIPLILSAKNPTEMPRVSSKKPGKENERISDKLDPVIGISIIMVTLIIMLAWGRLCAILCTCAWLYFVPRLRNHNPGQPGAASGKPDFNSEEYKKRVILEGFLERNRRRSIS